MRRESASADATQPHPLKYSFVCFGIARVLAVIRHRASFIDVSFARRYIIKNNYVWET